MAISFKPLAESDLATLTEWLQRPHVVERWDSRPSLEDVRATYLPCIADSSKVAPFLAYVEDLPVGYIQSYVAMGSGDGWWPDEQDPGVRGIDLFLADSDRLGQGIGTAIIGEFVRRLFTDPGVTSIQADPAPENGRAIRSYEKAGFTRVGVISTPDGPALLMTVERPDGQA